MKTPRIVPPEISNSWSLKIVTLKRNATYVSHNNFSCQDSKKILDEEARLVQHSVEAATYLVSVAYMAHLKR